MATGKITLDFPRAEEFVKEKEAKAGVKLSDIRGKRIALVDDGRPNADIALAGLREVLVKDYASEVFIAAKPSSEFMLYGISPAILDRVASQADAAVIGVAT